MFKNISCRETALKLQIFSSCIEIQNINPLFILWNKTQINCLHIFISAIFMSDPARTQYTGTFLNGQYTKCKTNCKVIGNDFWTTTFDKAWIAFTWKLLRLLSIELNSEYPLLLTFWLEQHKELHTALSLSKILKSLIPILGSGAKVYLDLSPPWDVWIISWIINVFHSENSKVSYSNHVVQLNV